ncbi:6-phosphogluconolactonase [Luteitalea pratensis]|uniref:6-phosphogluconolactonase n=1 Tax=Luteitalea pratensis TaxID=1855912 RepID=A0A143PK71_LUTPR|nr:lactonase family protein [Luteitalea pratensis]AMY08965.1 6-phosphogluconolactonase [Luteitalea pratensis]
MRPAASKTLTTRTLTRRSFVTAATGLASVAPALARGATSQASTSSGGLFAYVGTYSSPPVDAPPGKVDLPPGNGRGIHIFRVDRTTGTLTAAGVTDHYTSPSALVFDATGTHLYSTNATDLVDNGASGTVSAFTVDRTSGQLQLLNSVASGGTGPTYASVHRGGRHLLVANYAGGSVAVLPILPDGRLGPATDVKKTTGVVGPKRATHAPPGSFAISGHDTPHAHMIGTDPAGRFVIVPDLGLDRIFVWAFDANAGTLSPADPPSVALPPGDGPRHFAFHRDGRWLYAIQEEGSTIVLFDYDAERGRLSARQTISSLPAGYAGSNFCSGILISQDGRFVYAGNRLHDSVGIFAVGRDGTLTFVDDIWTRGDYPRSMTIDPSGRFMYVCNQRADHVTAFAIDGATGRLAFTGQYTPVGNPSAIAFLDTGRG